MDLIPNTTFRVFPTAADQFNNVAPGIYRVILDLPREDLTVTVLISSDKPRSTSRGGRLQKNSIKRHQKKKAPPPLVGELLWLSRSDLVSLSDAKCLNSMSISRPGSLELGEAAKAVYTRRQLVMSKFLDLHTLHESIITNHGLGGLVADACREHGASRANVYKLWSLLCMRGLDSRSLTPNFDQCGAPRVRRPCEPPVAGLPARKKAGRKTLKERISLTFGVSLDPETPGMNSEWTAAIRAADNQIPEPKPAWPKRCEMIVTSAFCGKAVENNGRLELVKPELGKYPNEQQIKRALTVDKSRLQLLLEKTTRRHFESVLRGLRARNWQDVAGPGHTWAIDSTVGDIYLRSSVRRDWIVGRPIVYLIVDVWSTAVVGFYVCLTGPSWNTARVALFNAAVDPTLIGDLWGYQPMLTLQPLPTLCHALMCDRGEYLSKAQRSLAVKYLPMTSYAPPYRGDLKGLVEVLHRIEKDAQFLFIPGAMDYRRAELELRKVDPADAVFTVREYVHYLHQLFTDYNLSADRRHRVDAHMISAGVFPSPAGLWRFGHDVGVGFRRHVPLSDFITDFLPDSVASVRRDGVVHSGCHYSSEEIEQEQWTALARNFGGWRLPVHYYPGAMRSIWAQRVGGGELLHLLLSDQTRASPELTMDEWLDVRALECSQLAQTAHARMMTGVDAIERMKRIRDSAVQLTEEAMATAKRDTPPSMSEARAMEVAAGHPSRSEAKVIEEVREDAMEVHRGMMDALLARS